MTRRTEWGQVGRYAERVVFVVMILAFFVLLNSAIGRSIAWAHRSEVCSGVRTPLSYEDCEGLSEHRWMVIRDYGITLLWGVRLAIDAIRFWRSRE